MKKMFIFGMAVVLFSIGYLATGDAQKNEIGKTGDITKYLPENAEVMFKLGSLETLYEHFSVTENSVFGKSVGDIANIEKTLGFNPLVISELRANGFDTGKTIGFLADNIVLKEKSPASEPASDSEEIWKQLVFDGLFFVPVTNAQKATEKIKALIINKFPSVKFKTEGLFTVFGKKDTPFKGYLLEKNQYLFLCMNPETDAKALMESIAAGKTALSDSEAYKNVTATLDPGKGMFVYANVKKIVEKNLSVIKNISKLPSESNALDMAKNLEYLKEYEAMGMSADLEPKDLVVKSVFNMVPGSRYLNLLKDGQFHKDVVLGIKAFPALLLSSSVNVPKYYEMLLETLTQDGMKKFKDRLKKIKTDFGIDVEKDLIGNLGGNFNVGIYDGASITMVNYNALATLAVKDGAKMKTVMDKAIAALSPEQQAMISKTMVGKDEVHIFNMLGMLQLYACVKDHDLIVSVGKPMFEKAVNGDMSSGFVSGMKDQALAHTLKEDVSLFYMNIDELFKAIGNFPFLAMQMNAGKPFDENMANAIDPFEHILTTSRVKGNAIHSDLTIQTKFSEPFFKGACKSLKALHAPGPRAERTMAPAIGTP